VEGPKENRRGEEIPPSHVTRQARQLAFSCVALASAAFNAEVCGCVVCRFILQLLLVLFCLFCDPIYLASGTTWDEVLAEIKACDMHPVAAERE